MYAEAVNRELYTYYIREFQAIALPPIDHPYRFMLSGAVTAGIKFDLRAYEAYVSSHHLSQDDITAEILEQFKL